MMSLTFVSRVSTKPVRSVLMVKPTNWVQEVRDQFANTSAHPFIDWSSWAVYDERKVVLPPIQHTHQECVAYGQRLTCARPLLILETDGAIDPFDDKRIVGKNDRKPRIALLKQFLLYALAGALCRFGEQILDNFRLLTKAHGFGDFSDTRLGLSQPLGD